MSESRAHFSLSRAEEAGRDFKKDDNFFWAKKSIVNLSQNMRSKHKEYTSSFFSKDQLKSETLHWVRGASGTEARAGHDVWTLTP